MSDFSNPVPQQVLSGIFPAQMQEMDLSKADAERTLREHGGDLIKTLHTLII